jgi:hypothetical protein
MDKQFNKPKLYARAGVVVAAVVVVVLTAWIVFGRSLALPSFPASLATPVTATDVPANATTIEAMKKAGPSAGTPLFEVHVADLPTAGSKFTCARAAELKERAGTTLAGATSSEAGTVGLFWESESTPNQFLYYETGTRLLMVCDGHSAASTTLKDNGLGPRDEIVKIDQPNFGDWAHDGKFEFLIFRGQCDEGPCVGFFYLMQIDGSKLVELADINASAIETVQMSVGGVARTSLQIHSTCYGVNFDPVFEYVALVDFGGANVLSLVPPQQIRVRSPELIQQMSDSSDLDSDGSGSQPALAKLQPLIFQSYQSRPLADLKRQYDAILAGIPNLRAGDPPPLRCDPVAILTMISEGQ